MLVRFESIPLGGQRAFARLMEGVACFGQACRAVASPEMRPPWTLCLQCCHTNTTQPHLHIHRSLRSACQERNRHRIHQRFDLLFYLKTHYLNCRTNAWCFSLQQNRSLLKLITLSRFTLNTAQPSFSREISCSAADTSLYESKFSR